MGDTGNFSIQEVEALILSLYEPNSPEVISRTQAILSQLQSSKAAWALSRDLLSRPDEKVKFYGVLTIIVKLNTESTSLSQENADELLGQLIGWYYDALASSTGLVARKLSSAISTFFIHFHQWWPRLLQYMSQRLTQYFGGVGVGTEVLHLRAMIWVLANILEDCAKLDLNSPQSGQLYRSIMTNTEDAHQLLERVLGDKRIQQTLLDDAVRSLQSWVWFCLRASVNDNQVLLYIRRLLGTTIGRLFEDNPSDTITELLTDVLNSYPSLLLAEHSKQLIGFFTGHGACQPCELIFGEEGGHEGSQFAHLFLAYAQANHESLMKDMNVQSQQFLGSVRDLLSLDGYPVIDDDIFVPAIEFWSNFAETLAFEIDSPDNMSQPWTQPAIALASSVVSLAWQRTIYPAPEQAVDWDTNDRISFHEARKDVVDLLQATFALVGPDVVMTFTSIALENIHEQSWMRVEAALAYLAGLADCAREDQRCDEAMSSLFASELFNTLQNTRLEIPHRTRKAAIALIENYTDYFERNNTYLPAALRVLFAVIDDPSLASSASKSILRLCSCCRHHLYPEVESFLSAYSEIVSSRRLDCAASVRVLGAIAAVAQAIPDSASSLDIASRLLNFAERDLKTAFQASQASSEALLPCAGARHCYADEGDGNFGLHLVLKALRSLVHIGKGFQGVVDGPVDVDVDLSAVTGTEPGIFQLHERVFSLLYDAPKPYGFTFEIAEHSWTVLRSGFAETKPGLFVFRAEDVLKYIIQHDSGTPCLGALIKTTCAFISSFGSSNEARREETFCFLFDWIIKLISQLPEPEDDTELSQNSIEFAIKLLSKSPATIISVAARDRVEFFFMFTLKVLNGKEPLPKAAAADFWSTFIGLQAQDEAVQAAAVEVVVSLGPILCQILARNIGGGASRSELDKLSEPVKKLVTRFPQSRQWLENGVVAEGFPGASMDLRERHAFVRKIIGLRGSRATNQVIREFWMSCRGSHFAYAT